MSIVVAMTNDTMSATGGVERDLIPSHYYYYGKKHDYESKLY